MWHPQKIGSRQRCRTPRTEAEPLEATNPGRRTTPKEIPVLQRLRAARKNESGFTLIELLIVIVILGVLAGIVVFAVGAFNDRRQGRRLQGRQEVRRGRGRGVPRQDRRLPAQRRLPTDEPLVGHPRARDRKVPARGAEHRDYTITLNDRLTCTGVRRAARSR